MVLIGVWDDVTLKVLSAAMVGVSIDAFVDIVVASVLIYLELDKRSSYTVDMLAGDWAETVIDLSIFVRVGELIDALARGYVDVMTALNFSMSVSFEERLRFC